MCRALVEVLVEHAEKAAEVRVMPIAAGSFALLDDRLDRGLGGLEVMNRDQPRESEVLTGRLRRNRPDEQAVLADSRCKRCERPSSIERYRWLIVSKSATIGPI